MKKVAPKMTLDKLATMVASGFMHLEEKMVTKEEFNKFKKDVDRQFNDVDKKFKDVEGNLQSIRRDILQVGDRFISRQEFENLVTRFNNLENKVKAKIK